MKRIILAIIACMVIISCSDNPIETGTKDFRVSVTMLRNKLTSGTAGTVAFRVESNKQTVTVEDFSIVYKQTGETASWINFINFPFGANYTDSHDIQLNSNGYAEFWTEPIEVGTRSGAYEIRVRFYDASTKSYSDTFILEFVAAGEERAESAGIKIEGGYVSKMNTPNVLSYNLGQAEATMTVQALKSVNGQTSYSGNIGLIDNNSTTKVFYIKDELLYDRQNIIDTQKSNYSLFIWKENSYSETSTVFRMCPGASFEPGSFDLYDKDDPSNRVTVTTYLRTPVCLRLMARVGDTHSKKRTPNSLPYKLQSYGWYGTFNSDITAEIIKLHPVGNMKDYITNISTKPNYWDRRYEKYEGDYHIGAEKSNNYDNGFHIYDFEDPTTATFQSDDPFAVTISIVTGWSGTITSDCFKGNRGPDEARYRRDLEDNKISIPKDGRRDFPVVVTPDNPQVVSDLKDAMNYCCNLVTIANGFTTGEFCSTACSQKDSRSPLSFDGFTLFGLRVTSMEYNRDKYNLIYFLEWYRGIAAPEIVDRQDKNSLSHGLGEHGYKYQGGRTVWYEGCGVSPVQDLREDK